MANQSQTSETQRQKQSQGVSPERQDPDPQKQLGSNDPHSGKQQMQDGATGDRKGRPKSAPHHPDAKSLAQANRGPSKADEAAAIEQQKEAGRRQSDQI